MTESKAEPTAGEPTPDEAAQAAHPVSDPFVPPTDEPAHESVGAASTDPTAGPLPDLAAAPAAGAAAHGPHYLSIVAFALGLAGVVAPGLPSIAAIILGHIGLAKEPSGRTFAIIGLVAGYVMVGMFVIGMIIFISIWGIMLSSILAAVPFMDGIPRR